MEDRNRQQRYKLEQQINFKNFKNNLKMTSLDSMLSKIDLKNEQKTSEDDDFGSFHQATPNLQTSENNNNFTTTIPQTPSSGFQQMKSNSSFSIPWLNNPSSIPLIYHQILEASISIDGLIDTGKVYHILLQSLLSTEILGYLWSIANQTLPGRLNQYELFILLALIALVQSGDLNPNLYKLSLLHSAPIPNFKIQNTPLKDQHSTNQISSHKVEPQITSNNIQQHPVAPGSLQQHPAAPGSLQQHPVAPGSLQQHPVAPGSFQQHSVAPGSLQQHPVAPGSSLQHSVGPESFQQHPVGPGSSQQHPVAPESLQHHPVGPGSLQQHSVAPESLQQHPVGPGSSQQHPVAPESLQHHPVGPGSLQQHPVAPESLQQHPVAPGIPQQHPVAPGSIQQHPVALESLQQHPVGPGSLQKHPVSPGSLQKHPVAPGSSQQHPALPKNVPSSNTSESSTKNIFLNENLSVKSFKLPQHPKDFFDSLSPPSYEESISKSSFASSQNLRDEDEEFGDFTEFKPPQGSQDHSQDLRSLQRSEDEDRYAAFKDQDEINLFTSAFADQGLSKSSSDAPSDVAAFEGSEEETSLKDSSKNPEVFGDFSSTFPETSQPESDLFQTTNQLTFNQSDSRTTSKISESLGASDPEVDPPPLDDFKEDDFGDFSQAPLPPPLPVKVQI